MRRPVPAVAATAVLPLLGLLAGACALAGPAAAADEPAITKTPVTLTVNVGPDGATECVVDADLYVPAGVTADAPAPAVLTTNGFGGSKDDQAGAAQAFGREGYVTLSYTGLGFPNSGCKIALDDPDYDGKAAKQLVDYLAGLKADDSGRTLDVVATDAAGDPKVGMIGGSYGGQVQFAAASVDPRIDALVPLITWNDLSYSLAPNNTSLTKGVTYATPGVHKKQWTSLFFAIGIADGIQGAGIDPSRLVGCPNFVTQACLAKAQMETLGYPDQATMDFARHASVSSYMSKVKAPTLLVQGQKDTLFNLQEAAATYRGLQAQGTPVQMIWQSWGHSLGGTPAPGELDLSGASDLRATYLGGRFLDWFDRYVKGDTSVGTGPEFSYFRDWVDYSGIATPAYATSDTFPVGRPLDLFLSGAKDLVAAAARRAARRAELGQRPGRRADQLLGDLVAGRPGRGPAAGDGRARHVRVVDLRAGADRDGARRVADARRPADLAGRRATQSRGPGGPARRSSPRSTTWRRTAPRRCTTGSSRRCGSPTSPSRCTSSCPGSCSGSRPGTGSASCWPPATRRTPATRPCCR